MNQLTTNPADSQAFTYPDGSLADQSGETKPPLWDLNALADRQWDEPAELEEIGPDDFEAQWWAEHSEDDPIEPAEWEPAPVTDDGYGLPSDEALEEMAGSFAYHLAMEVFQPRPGRLTDADVMTATGCAG